MVDSERTEDLAARVETKDLPSVNGHGRKEIRLSISVIIGIIMMMVGVATFASNFIFATKSEVLTEQIKRLESEKSVQANVAEVRNDVSHVKSKVENVSTELEKHSNDAKARYDVLDENLRKLLLREGVRPVPRPEK